MSIFKDHIFNAKINLSGKAGRTRAEILEKYQIDDFHKMSSNENALGPSPRAMEAVKSCLERLHEYGHRTDDQLRLALHRHFEQRLGADQYITTNSGLEMLELAIQGFVDVGDEVIISNPTFHVYEIFCQLAGAQVVDVPLDPSTFRVDVKGILKAVTPKTKLLFITNPNNPCGVGISRAEMDAIVEHVPSTCVVLIDEVYYHFHAMDDFPYAHDYVEKGYQVIGLHSFSKAYGLAGIRLAYGFSTPEIAEYLQKLRRPFFINTMTMEAGLAALEDHDHIRRTQAMVAEGKRYLYDHFDRLGIRYWPSHTNFILIRPEGNHEELIEELMHQGVAVRSGDNNGANGCIRITIGEAQANEDLVKALEQVGYGKNL